MKDFFKFFLLLLAVLSVLFQDSFKPGLIPFSNDAPHGMLTASWCNPTEVGSRWLDTNLLGQRMVGWPVNLTWLIRIGAPIFCFGILLLIIGGFYVLLNPLTKRQLAVVKHIKCEA